MAVSFEYISKSSRNGQFQRFLDEQTHTRKFVYAQSVHSICTATTLRVIFTDLCLKFVLVCC